MELIIGPLEADTPPSWSVWGLVGVVLPTPSTRDHSAKSANLNIKLRKGCGLFLPRWAESELAARNGQKLFESPVQSW